MKEKTNYENLSKQSQPKKVLEALKKVEDIKNGKQEDTKEGVDLTALAKKVAQKRMEEEKVEEESPKE